MANKSEIYDWHGPQTSDGCVGHLIPALWFGNRWMAWLAPAVCAGQPNRALVMSCGMVVVVVRPENVKMRNKALNDATCAPSM